MQKILLKTDGAVAIVLVRDMALQVPHLFNTAVIF